MSAPVPAKGPSIGAHEAPPTGAAAIARPGLPSHFENVLDALSAEGDPRTDAPELPIPEVEDARPSSAAPRMRDPTEVVVPQGLATAMPEPVLIDPPDAPRSARVGATPAPAASHVRAVLPVIDKTDVRDDTRIGGSLHVVTARASTTLARSTAGPVAATADRPIATARADATISWEPVAPSLTARPLGRGIVRATSPVPPRPAGDLQASLKAALVVERFDTTTVPTTAATTHAASSPAHLERTRLPEIAIRAVPELVASRIREGAAPSESIQLRLLPRSLGMVEVEITRSPTGMAIEIRIETPEALRLLEAEREAFQNQLRHRAGEATVDISLGERGDAHGRGSARHNEHSPSEADPAPHEDAGEDRRSTAII